MRRRLTRALAGIAALVLAAGCGGATATGRRTTPQSDSTSPAAAVRSTNALAIDLLHRLGAPTENAVFSPYNIQAALAMVYAGAAGETATEIGRVLHAAASSAAALGASNAELAHRLAMATSPSHPAPARDAPKLNVANSLWVSAHLSLEHAFSGTLSNDFGAIPHTADFQGDPDSARHAINSYIAGHTAGRIRQLMPPGSITSQTALVLASAIYLKAHWSSPFNPGDTAPRAFTTGPGRRVRAPFMTQPATDFAYLRRPAYQAIELPYLYSTLSMMLVMPGPGTFARFQRRLTPSSLAALERSLRPAKIRLRMPRFHLALQTALERALSALGMPIAFTDRANFTGIAVQPPLKISVVQHGADLAVDENGTVATAATGISIGPTATAPSPAIPVTLDHPFLLFLTDDSSGAILFAGRVVDPTKP